MPRRAGERLVVPGHPDYEPESEFTEPCAWETNIIGFRKPVGFRKPTAESAHLKPYDGVKQDDGWDADCS